MDCNIYFILIIIVIGLFIIYYNTYKFKYNIEHFFNDYDLLQDKQINIQELLKEGYVADFSNEKFLITKYTFLVNNINDIYQKILESMSFTLNRTTKQHFFDNIYVVIEQKNSDCNIEQNTFLSGVEAKETILYILYPMYIVNNDSLIYQKNKLKIYSYKYNSSYKEIYMINKNHKLFKHFFTNITPLRP